MQNLYFIDEDHEQLTREFLARFNMDSVYDDREYGVLSYLLGAVGKRGLLRLCEPHKVQAQKMLEDSGPYSTTEHNFIRLGLHLFNDRWGRDLTFMELFQSLGKPYRQAVHAALEIRFNIFS